MPDPTARKTVKNITIAGITGGVYSASVIDGRTTTNGEVAAYGDTLFTTAASPVLHAADLTVDILDEGGQFAAIKALVGTTVAVTLTPAYGDGSSTTYTSGDGGFTSTNCVILSATGDSVPVDGYGQSLIHVTLRRQA